MLVTVWDVQDPKPHGATVSYQPLGDDEAVLLLYYVLLGHVGASWWGNAQTA